MENINNTNIPTTPIVSEVSEVSNIPNPSPKSNIFKYLFIISIIVLLTVIISFYLILSNKISKLSSIQSNNNISQEIPTNSNQKDNKSNINAYIKADSKNTNLVLKKDNQEFIIDSFVTDFMFFDNIKFTGSLRYLSYSIKGPGSTIVKIYDTQNNSFIKNEGGNGFFTQSSDSPFITNDEKFLIFCSGGDMDGIIDGARIISLPNSIVKFDFVKYLDNKINSTNISCYYQQKTNTITFNYFKDQNFDNPVSISYNLETNLVE